MQYQQGNFPIVIVGPNRVLFSPIWRDSADNEVRAAAV